MATSDELAMARATFALLLSLLPATAALIGFLVLRQVPKPAGLLGTALAIGGVALHRAEGQRAAPCGADGTLWRAVFAAA